MHLRHPALRRFWVTRAGFAVCAALFGPPAFAQTDTPTDTMIIFDASGSMWGQIDGVTKIEIARDAFATAADGWAGADADRFGLMAYGHRRKGDCGDIELLIPPGAQTVDAISDAVAGLTPTGKTPLAAALTQAADAMRIGENPATVVLFSDGVETCNANPCAVAQELSSLGIDFTAHVIGFGITSESDRAQLSCIADATGGLYRDAGNLSDLSYALQEIGTQQPVISANEDAAALIDLNLQISIADGSVRPGRINLRATNMATGETRRLGALAGADQIITGLDTALPAGQWRFDVTSSEGGGATEVDVTAGLTQIKIPFTANAARFSLVDNGPYRLGVEHYFFLNADAPLQENATITVGLVPQGAGPDAFIDSEYRFGTDPAGQSVHSFASPSQGGDYDVIVEADGAILARFPVRYDAQAVPTWKGAGAGAPGTALDLRITGDLDYFNGISLVKDGIAVVETTVDEATSPDGWHITLPQDPGVYTLRYSYSDNGEQVVTDLTEIVVGDVILADDPDAVAPPETALDAAPTAPLAAATDSQSHIAYPFSPDMLFGAWTLVNSETFDIVGNVLLDGLSTDGHLTGFVRFNDPDGFGLAAEEGALTLEPIIDVAGDVTGLIGTSVFDGAEVSFQFGRPADWDQVEHRYVGMAVNMENFKSLRLDMF